MTNLPPAVEKEPEVIEELTLTISNRREVLGDDTWCIDHTRVPVRLVIKYLDQGGLKLLTEMYPWVITAIDKQQKGFAQKIEEAFEKGRKEGADVAERMATVGCMAAIKATVKEREAEIVAELEKESIEHFSKAPDKHHWLAHKAFERAIAIVQKDKE